MNENVNRCRTRPIEYTTVRWSGDNREELEALGADANDRSRHPVFGTHPGEPDFWFDGGSLIPLRVGSWILLSPAGSLTLYSENAFRETMEMIEG